MYKIWYTSPPGYVGTRIQLDLLNITNSVLSLKRGQIGLYEQCRSMFEGGVIRCRVRTIV